MSPSSANKLWKRWTQNGTKPQGGRGDRLNILLTNDDGIHAPGLEAMERELQRLGEVETVAPLSEQSGIGHSITFLTPLFCREIWHGEKRRGWAVDGRPADCVKLGISELTQTRPDLVVSGINGGLNAGINVLYSGTVAAAIEGGFFGITSIAVSLEYDENAQFDKAARLARRLIEQIMEKSPSPGQIYNLNIPTVATLEPAELRIVPMGMSHYGSKFVKRTDPKGRSYFWMTGDPAPQDPEDRETDLVALKRGFVTLTPLAFDMTDQQSLKPISEWDLRLD